MDEKDFWIGLNMVPGLGKVLFYRLLDFFGSAENVFKAREKDLCRVEGIGPGIAGGILRFPLSREVEKELAYVQNNNARVFISREEDYPENLKNIFDPPPVLYMQGTWLKSDVAAVAVVGTRSPSLYGRHVAEKISMELARRGVTVVSGMARGIDSFAHKGALEGGGRTVAVFGCGLNVIYPAENVKLRNRILKQGALVSEYPMARKPDRGNFPARNRIISGLSLGTIVVEAGERSGALITTQFALEQGREVFAVPGNIDAPKSRGPNLLIKKGAKLVGSAEDVIEEIPPYVREAFLKEIKSGEKGEVKWTEEETKILSALESGISHIDALIEQSRLPAGKVSALLLTLELNGVVKQLPGKMFVVG